MVLTLFKRQTRPKWGTATWKWAEMISDDLRNRLSSDILPPQFTLLTTLSRNTHPANPNWIWSVALGPYYYTYVLTSRSIQRKNTNPENWRVTVWREQYVELGFVSRSFKLWITPKTMPAYRCSSLAAARLKDLISYSLKEWQELSRGRYAG